MGQQEFLWFFAIFHHEFRKHNLIAFEGLMVLAVANVLGCSHPKQGADVLEVPQQKCYAALQEWRISQAKKMLLRFMVKQAAEQLKRVMGNSDATQSRAGRSVSIDKRVIDRFGKLIRCA